jgi:hypothetical protein
MTRIRQLSGIVLALAVAIATPAFADTYLVYTQGGLPPASNLFTWCDAGQPCDVSAPLSCENDPFAGVVASPEGGNSLRTRANVWAGWGVFLTQQLDLTAYENGELRFFVKAPDSGIGPFNVKVEFQCNPDPINFPGGVTYTTSIRDHGWNGTTNWQEIAIPVCDFFPGGTCDPQCLATVKSPFLATIENLPYLNAFWIDYVRWQTPNSHSGASSVQVQGRQLVVDGEPFVVNGVAYSPISIGENWAAAWADRPDRYTVDFPLIAASGANTVRLYAPVVSTAMLDAAWAEGLYVIPTFGVDSVQLTCTEGKNFMRDRFREMVLEWGNHPSILFWLVGNEVNTNLGAADLCADWYPQLDSMALAAHTAEGPSFHPVATANADTTGLADICLGGCSDDTSLPNVDLWGVQLYRGCSFETAFTEYQKPDCARPLVITEFGVDSWDSLLPGESELMQANCMEDLLVEAADALAVQTPGGVSSGQVIFEWLDEWWKAECDPGTAWTAHDTCNSFTNSAYPDPGINEEWWGIVSQDSADPDARGLRAAYDRVVQAWGFGPVCNADVVARDAASGDLTLSFDPAAGSTDHTLYYGPLHAVSTYGYTGSINGLGVTGSAEVTLPEGSLFWIIAPLKNGTEGCYGLDSGGVERPCFPDASACSVAQATSRTCQCTNP